MLVNNNGSLDDEPLESQEHWERVDSGTIVSNETPEGIWQNATSYFRWCKDNPIQTKRTVMVGKEAGKKFIIEQVRPYNVKALCLHCGLTEEYLKDIRNSKQKDSLWYIVVSKILLIIYVQNFEMAQTENFNPQFTAKVLGMDKEQEAPSAIKIEIVPGLPKLSNSENEILEKLELENENSEILKDKNT